MKKISFILIISAIILNIKLLNCYAEENYNLCINIKEDSDIYKDIINGKRKVTYECFGAKGDGKTNDYEAIKKTHDFANELYANKGILLTVYGNKNSTYYIGVADEIIDIYTHVDWNNANFIFDDYIDADNDGKNDVKYNSSIFNITSPFKATGITYVEYKNNDLINTLTGINTKTKNVKSIIEYVKNDSNLTDKQKQYFNASKKWHLSITGCEKIYIRKGINANSGSYKTDDILLDSSSGNILSPIDWEYSCIRNIRVFPVPETTIEVKNATITTYTNNVVYYEGGIRTDYNQRNIRISETGNVKLSNITHYLDEEKHKYTSEYQTRDNTNFYYGIIGVYNTSYTELENIKLSAHTAPNKVADNEILTKLMGTYDIIVNTSTNIKLNGISYACKDNEDDSSCYNENILNKKTRWGIIGTNNTKNFTIINSKMNRMDSHMGLTNLAIKDTVIGSRGLTMIGKGYLYANNITFDEPNNIINLRDDYGSTWDGDILLTNSIYNYPSSTTNAYLINSLNEEDHDFGYNTYFPNVFVNNLKIDLSKQNNNANFYLINLNSNITSQNNNSDERLLYYFKDNAYFNNISYNSNNISMSVFPNSFISNEENLKITNYGSTNKYSINYNGDITNNLINNTNNTKFNIISGINGEAKINEVANEMKKYFNNLEDINIFNNKAKLLNNISIDNGKLVEEYSNNKFKYTLYTTNDKFTINMLLNENALYIKDWDFSTSHEYKTNINEVITINIYGIYGNVETYEFKIIDNLEEVKIKNEEIKDNPKTSQINYHLGLILTILIIIGFIIINIINNKKPFKNR